jgi:DNA-directed RNA polymerase subunit RPC12/RpoP
LPELKEFKCPACGGPMDFDGKTQKMRCPYCGTELAVDEYQDSEKKDAETVENRKSGDSACLNSDDISWHAESDGSWAPGETRGMNVYVCESCGGEIVADRTTGAAICPYCGNRVVMKEQFSGDLRPDYIIPFKFDKKDAIEGYRKHLKGKPFLPGVFRRRNQIDDIKGLYVPVWVYDVEASADLNISGEITSGSRRGDYEVTKHSVYSLRRSGDISFRSLPSDGSKKMDDALMESVEPYDFRKAVPFNPAYMAGYMADRYDEDEKQRQKKALARVEKSIEDSFMAACPGYTNLEVRSKNIDVKKLHYSYALYPVWLLNISWRSEKFTFAMNGQTGKFVGDLPCDRGAMWRFILLGTLGASALAVLVQWLLWML